MNIQEAKTEIVRTFRAYMKQTPEGRFCIPVQKQRPVLLIGPPGIGKTAVMEQIAAEEQIGLVAYTMTHHTRQSAVGLPIIREKEYGGRHYSVTEYTMSEIVASVYDCMRETGHTHGILFLDEINCVSETLAPVMLQLLQNKQFGTHAIPAGWMIAAAGNPPEYNKSVRELDMATLDRVKHMEIEADLQVWMDYAFTRKIHPSITAYLTIHPEHFYRIEDTPKGQLFVTARGWEDLSCMLHACEEDGMPVPESLFIQYIQHDEIARSFYLFYDLFRHFATDENADLWSCTLQNAKISQGLAMAASLMAGVRHEAVRWKRQTMEEKALEEALAGWPQKRNPAADNPAEALAQIIESRRRAMKIREEQRLTEPETLHLEQLTLRKLEDLLQAYKKSGAESGTASQYGANALEQESRNTKAALERLTDTIRRSYQLLETFPGDEPLLYFTADLTAEPDCAQPLALSPCAAYTRYAGQLLLTRQEQKLKDSLKD